MEWVKWQSPPSVTGSAIFLTLCNTAVTNPPGVNIFQLMVDSGIVECAVDALKAFELHGSGAVDDANIGLFAHAAMMIRSLGFTGWHLPEARPIVEQLRQIPSSLKFVLSHNLDHIKSIGMTTASICAQICAELFGRQEDGFEFSEQQINLVLAVSQGSFDGDLHMYVAKTPHFLKPIVALCISDANKTLLVKSSALLVPLLLSTLFLEADHILSDLDRDIKAAIQTDAANCFLQIAVFGPGREMLAAEGAAMEALHALADGHALTPEAKLSAAGAIMAIEGRSHEPQPESMAVEHGVEGKHLMVSCECRRQLLAWIVLTDVQLAHRSMGRPGHDRAARPLAAGPRLPRVVRCGHDEGQHRRCDERRN